jgi:U3 small nucleolar ribonucleoprotein protein IMP4
MDDEYIRAGEVDPRVMITTSRNPSSRLVQFSKEMTHIFPNAQVCTVVFVQLYLYM